MRFFLVLLLLFQIWLAACVGPEHAADNGVVAAKTIVPKRIAAPPPAASVLRLSPGIVYVSHVRRPRAELREGPGVQFRLLEKLLKEGDDVVVFQRVGVWRKVALRQGGDLGWVHYQALAKLQKNRRQIDMTVKRLPRVMTVRSVKGVLDFTTRQRHRVAIAKGTIFHALRWSKGHVLVHLPQTQSVAWLTVREAK